MGPILYFLLAALSLRILNRQLVIKEQKALLQLKAHILQSPNLRKQGILELVFNSQQILETHHYLAVLNLMPAINELDTTHLSIMMYPAPIGFS